MTTIATVRALVRKDLHDEDASNYRWTDAVLDRASFGDDPPDHRGGGRRGTIQGVRGRAAAAVPRGSRPPRPGERHTTAPHVHAAGRAVDLRAVAGEVLAGALSCQRSASR